MSKHLQGPENTSDLKRLKRQLDKCWRESFTFICDQG